MDDKESQTRLITGVYTDETDLTTSGHQKLRLSVSDMLNKKRERMPQLDPISLIVVDGGDMASRSRNVAMLEVASQAAAYSLTNDDPHSEFANWAKENGRSPFLFRRLSVTVSGQQRPALAVCLNGAQWNAGLGGVKHDFVGELGLVLTRLDLRSIYPRNWEGQQTATPETIQKS